MKWGWVADRADWTKPNADIARRLRVPIPVVSTWRLRLRRRGRKIPGAVEATWEKRRAALTAAGIGRVTDTEAGIRMGLCRERIRQLRNQMGIPVNLEAARTAAREKMKKRLLKLDRPAWPTVRRMLRSGRTLRAIGDRVGVSSCVVNHMAARHGVAIPRTKSFEERWLNLDWNRLNTEIAEERAVRPSNIAQIRSRLRKMGFRVPPSPYSPTTSPKIWTPRRVKAVDWSAPNEALAAELGFRVKSITWLKTRLRRQGYRIPYKKRGPKGPRAPRPESSAVRRLRPVRN